MAKSAKPKKVRSELKNTAYEIFIGVLSILSILNLVLVYVFRSDPSLQTVLSVMNGLFSVIFLIDFVYRIFTAPSATRYFFRDFGWADLLASLPFAELKVLRVFRLVRVYRLLRKLGVRTLVRTLVKDRANSALMTLLLMGILVLEFGSISMLAIEENAEGANITNASDAIWYTIVTIATVGYGDTYPVTNLGRILGAVIIVVGIGIFGTFTGYLANVFLGPSKSDPSAEDEEDAATAAPDDDTVSAVDAGDDAAGSSLADAASRGVAAGAAAGAVGKGVDAAPDRAAAVPADVDAARLRALLEQSEATNAEIRRLLARSGT
ncbi:ion transporter [Microbacterium sp. NEAU-LLC]|uniref:Ion transporter n=2 Tax=Microbacterium helvum TaxID=2773713 RepID=A0ABR8NIE3_9MICO|nr:ion transporter [Microbacterium helvum]